MGTQVVNTANYAEHVRIQDGNGRQDEITLHPGGRSVLPSGWFIVNDFRPRPHLRIIADPAEEAAAKARAASAEQIGGQK